MQEQVKQQHILVKVYRTGERLMIAAPMAGLEPENMQKCRLSSQTSTERI